MTYPIVLAHGICRFDALLRDILQDEDAAEDRLHYFRGIRSMLAAHGFSVFHSTVPWAAGVSARARALKANVEQVLATTGSPKVHVIAHSMGGLDARHMLFEHQADRMHEKVASITTIGTPHRGTTFADWGVTNGSLVRIILRGLCIEDFDGFFDLTTRACEDFNEAAAGFEKRCGVLFQTVAGAQDLPYIFEPLQIPWAIIHANEGANDGLVSVSSATWRPEYLRAPVLSADHLNELGWWEPNDAGLLRFPFAPPRGETPLELDTRIRAVYVAIAQDLAARYPVA